MPLNIDILAADSGNFSDLKGGVVSVAQSILEQLKREVNRVNTRGIEVLPPLPAEQPIAIEGWATDEVLLRVLE